MDDQLKKSEAMHSRGIFVVGCQRSGTTLLRMMLNAHPKICSGEETFFLADLEKITGQYWGHLQAFPLERDEVLDMMRELFLRFHESYCSASGKQIWVDKTPAYLFHSDFISELFPGAKFIHIIRDGRDVAASYREKWDKIGYYRALWQWPMAMDRGKALRNSLDDDRYMEIRYEDLVQEPSAVLGQVLQFIGVEWSDAVLSHWKTKQITLDKYGFDRPLNPINKASVGRWDSYLTRWEKFLVLRGFSGDLKEQGYIDGMRDNKNYNSKMERLVRSLALIIEKSIRWRKRQQNRGGWSN